MKMNVRGEKQPHSGSILLLTEPLKVNEVCSHCTKTFTQRKTWVFLLKAPWDQAESESVSRWKFRGESAIHGSPLFPLRLSRDQVPQSMTNFFVSI